MRKYTIEKFALLIKDILHSNRDAMVVFSGFSGEGKTTFAIQLAKALSKVHDRKFSFDKQIAIESDDFLHKALSLPQYSTIIGDEAINIFFKRESLNKERIKSIKIMDTVRKRNLCLTLCVPQFWSLDNHIIQGKVRFWGYIDRRKACHLFKPIRHPFSEDVWVRRINKNVVRDWDDLSYINKIKNYMGTMEFEKLTPADEKEYYKVFKRKQEEQEKKIFKNIGELREFIRKAQMFRLLQLRNAKMLKSGAISFLAEMEGVGGSAIAERMSALEKNMKDFLKKNEAIFSENLKFQLSRD